MLPRYHQVRGHDKAFHKFARAKAGRPSGFGSLRPAGAPRFALASLLAAARMAPSCTALQLVIASSMAPANVHRVSLMRSGLCVLVAGFGFGCGGSSSETPPPQQPDSWQMVMRRPATPAASATATGKQSPWAWGRYNKAESTWGQKTRPHAVAFDAGVSDDL